MSNPKVIACTHWAKLCQCPHRVDQYVGDMTATLQWFFYPANQQGTKNTVCSHLARPLRFNPSISFMQTWLTTKVAAVKPISLSTTKSSTHSVTPRWMQPVLSCHCDCANPGRGNPWAFFSPHHNATIVTASSSSFRTSGEHDPVSQAQQGRRGSKRTQRSCFKVDQRAAEATRLKIPIPINNLVVSSHAHKHYQPPRYNFIMQCSSILSVSSKYVTSVSQHRLLTWLTWEVTQIGLQA